MTSWLADPPRMGEAGPGRPDLPDPKEHSYFQPDWEKRHAKLRFYSCGQNGVSRVTRFPAALGVLDTDLASVLTAFFGDIKYV